MRSKSNRERARAFHLLYAVLCNQNYWHLKRFTQHLSRNEKTFFLFIFFRSWVRRWRFCSPCLYAVGYFSFFKMDKANETENLMFLKWNFNESVKKKRIFTNASNICAKKADSKIDKFVLVRYFSIFPIDQSNEFSWWTKKYINQISMHFQPRIILNIKWNQRRNNNLLQE